MNLIGLNLTGIWIVKTLGKSLEISLKNDSDESKENWVNLNRRYLCEHERYKYSCRLCKGKAICEHGKQKLLL